MGGATLHGFSTTSVRWANAIRSDGVVRDYADHRGVVENSHKMVRVGYRRCVVGNNVRSLWGCPVRLVAGIPTSRVAVDPL